MSLIIDGQVIVGPGNSPYVGDNGNWFVGHKDTGFSAGTKFYYKTPREFKTCIDTGVYFVYDVAYESLEMWHIDTNGRKCQIATKSVIVPTKGSNGNLFIGDTDTGIHISEEGGAGGAAIDDESINTTTVWSSYKVHDELSKVQSGEDGKSLEFNWDKNKLGIRVEGATEYQYRDLTGPAGVTGLDGSSVVGARLNNNGELILKVQDIEKDKRHTHQIMSLETHVFTTADLQSILNNINRLNKEIYDIKTSTFRYVASLNKNNTEYQTVYHFTGLGNCQMLISPFVGTIKISIDGSVYTYTIEDSSALADTSLVAIDDNGRLGIIDLFHGVTSSSLDILFGADLNIEVKLAAGQTETPRILLQGSYYYSSPESGESGGEGSGGSGGYIPQTTMTEEEVDAMMGLL